MEIWYFEVATVELGGLTFFDVLLPDIVRKLKERKELKKFLNITN